MVMYPQCLGLCGQGRYDCEMPEQCTGALLLRYRNECRAQLAAEPELMGARMGMATYATEPGDLAPVRMWPWAEHSRTGKLTEAELDAHIAAKSTAPRIPRSRAMPSLMAEERILTDDDLRALYAQPVTGTHPHAKPAHKPRDWSAE